MVATFFCWAANDSLQAAKAVCIERIIVNPNIIALSFVFNFIVVSNNNLTCREIWTLIAYFFSYEKSLISFANILYFSLSYKWYSQKQSIIFFAHPIFFIPLPPKHQEQYKNLHQPSMTATVVKIRCGNKFNFKNKSLWTITCSNIQNSAILYFQTIVASNILWKHFAVWI